MASLPPSSTPIWIYPARHRSSSFILLPTFLSLFSQHFSHYREFLSLNPLSVTQRNLFSTYHTSLRSHMLLGPSRPITAHLSLIFHSSGPLFEPKNPSGFCPNHSFITYIIVHLTHSISYDQLPIITHNLRLHRFLSRGEVRCFK